MQFNFKMSIIKLRVNGDLIMIEKNTPISKSKYFDVLLSGAGPLAKPLDLDGSLSIDQEDAETFRNLVFFLRKEESPRSLKDVQYQALREMASIYLVDLPIIHQSVYFYCCKTTLNAFSIEAKFEKVNCLLAVRDVPTPMTIKFFSNLSPPEKMECALMKMFSFILLEKLIIKIEHFMSPLDRTQTQTFLTSRISDTWIP